MILFNIFPFAPPPPPLAFLCLKLFRSLYIWFSMPPVCHFPSFLYISLCCMTLDPLAGKWQLFCSSSQLLTEPENTRSGVRSGLCSVRRAHACTQRVHACTRAGKHVRSGLQTRRRADAGRAHALPVQWSGWKLGSWPSPCEEWVHAKRGTKREICHCRLMPFRCTFSSARLLESTHI